MKIDKTTSASSISQSIPKAAPSPGFVIGSVMTATVVQTLANRRVLLSFGRFKSTAKTKVPLKRGTKIKVKVGGTLDSVKLRLLDSQENQDDNTPPENDGNIMVGKRVDITL